MPDTCPRCNAAVDEQALLCPQCGNALIEQKTKAQLAREANQARGGLKVGLALGALVLFAALVGGAVLFSGGNTIASVVALSSGMATLVVLVAFAAIAVPVGAGLGYLVFRMRTRPSRPRVRTPQDEETKPQGNGE